MSLEELIQAARASGDLADFNRAIPYLRFLGIETLAVPDGAVLKMPFQEKLIGNPDLPALHGGITGALLESAAIATVILETEAGRLPRIVNLTIDYLRPGRPEDTFAQGQVTRLGRRVVSVHATAWQSRRESPIALANAHFLIA